MKTIILAAGEGKKLRPLTETRPKALIEICGETLMSRACRFLMDIGINNATIIIGPHGDKITQHFSSIRNPHFSVNFEVQTSSTGVGDALLTASERIDPSDYFLLLYSDILYSRKMLQSLLNSFHLNRKATATVCLTPNSSSFGNIYMDHTMKITKIIEKPDRSDLANYVLAGAFVLPGTIFQTLRECNGNFITALENLIQAESLYASIWEGDWIDIGYPWDILRASQIIMKEWRVSRIAKDIVQEPGSVIQGPVVIEPGVILKAGAYILGPCYIGPGSFIGHNALLRNYTSIGADSIIGFGVEMKNSVLFRNAEIGRLSFIGDSVIGENVNIGSGCVCVNINLDRSNISVHIGDDIIDSGHKKLGSFIGDNTWIGAGNTLLPGTCIRADSQISHHGTLSKTGER